MTTMADGRTDGTAAGRRPRTHIIAAQFLERRLEGARAAWIRACRTHRSGPPSQPAGRWKSVCQRRSQGRFWDKIFEGGARGPATPRPSLSALPPPLNRPFIGFWQPPEAGLNKHTGKSCTLPFPILPLEVGPLNTARGPGVL